MNQTCRICNSRAGKKYTSEKGNYSYEGDTDLFGSMEYVEIRYDLILETVCCDECLKQLLKKKKSSPEAIQNAIDKYLYSERDKWYIENRCEVCGADADFRVICPIEKRWLKYARINFRCQAHQNVPFPLFLQGMKDIKDDEIVCAKCEIRVPKDKERCPSCNEKIVTCKKCKTRVSRAAEKCPQCGYNLRKLPMGCSITVIIAFLAFIAWMVIVSLEY